MLGIPEGLLSEKLTSLVQPIYSPHPTNSMIRNSDA